MKKQVNYKVNGEEWKEAKDKAFNKLVKKVKIDGFREGKVPRNVFEKKYGTGDIISEAMEDLVQKKYGEVIITEKLIPVVEPKLEIVKADDEGFEVNMTFILDPEVTLGEYKGLKVPEVLLSGNFGKIEKWREEMAYEHTKNRRPDLLEE